MDFLQQLTLPENLHWAWEKAKRCYYPGDGWFDEGAIARFEANLDKELEAIRDQFEELSYQPSPLMPIARPKGGGKNRKYEARQYFWVPVRDQVAWIALVNVIGPWLDQKMPPWSYGHRLYRSVWVDDDAGVRPLRIGRYRHASGHLYRTWSQGWPLYRRHIYLTVRQMARGGSLLSLDEGDERVSRTENELPQAERLPYLQPGYWSRRSESLYWGTIDLKKFYPNIRLDKVLANLTDLPKIYPVEFDVDQIRQLVVSLFAFSVDKDGWLPDELVALGLPSENTLFQGLPTGLFVAGFLANVALLDTDIEVARGLKTGQVAHFRFVDDHTFVATTFDSLVKWIQAYEGLLKQQCIGAVINYQKVEPKTLGQYLGQRRDGGPSENVATAVSRKDALEATRLDPRFPTPLMTKTIAKVSALNAVEFDVLDVSEQRHLLQEAEHLLIADFPEHELRENTRVTFAARMISRLAPRLSQWSEEVASLDREIGDRRFAMKRAEVKLRELQGRSNSSEGTDALEKLRVLCTTQERELERLEKTRSECAERLANERVSQQHQSFQLLLKACEEHPDQLRLWIRVLQFCRDAGIGKLKQLFTALKRQTKQNPLTAECLFAFVRQFLANQVVDCCVEVASRSSLSQRRDTAMSFLPAAMGLLEKLSKERVATTSPKYYVASSLDLARWAGGTALLVLEEALSRDSGDKKLTDQLKSCAKRLGAIDWKSDPAGWASCTPYSLATWAWLSEERTNGGVTSEPGVVWRTVAPVLLPSDAAAWPFWQRHPFHLPDVVLESLGKSNALLQSLNQGWLLDAITAQPAWRHRIPFESRLPAAIKGVLLDQRDGTRGLVLYDWLKWQSRRFQEAPHDPRVSEWTALDIVEQIALRLRDFSEFEQSRLESIHPANYIVPRKWTEPCEGVLTWEKWKREYPREIVSRTAPLIRDPRFTPGIDNGDPDTRQLAPVHGLGMVLLALLRRSFEWPAQWNVPSMFRSRAHPRFHELHNVACSSWTSAILQACLFPRPRETLVLRKWNQPSGADDTATDPPFIYNLSTLERYIRKAKSVLERYHLTVQNHEPRQLIPLSLTQRTRAEWEQDVDVES